MVKIYSPIIHYLYCLKRGRKKITCSILKTWKHKKSSRTNKSTQEEMVTYEEDFIYCTYI